MYLLYADEAGSIHDPNQAHFVLAGVSLFERTGHWIEQEMNQIARRFSPLDPYQVEFHGSPMRFGNEGWETHPFRERIQAQIDVLTACVFRRHPRDLRLFGAVIRKAAVPGEDIAELAFEQLCSRFDHFGRGCIVHTTDRSAGSSSLTNLRLNSAFRLWHGNLSTKGIPGDELAIMQRFQSFWIRKRRDCFN
jgi:Protein of unknown function (DUF3800)